MPMHIYLQPVGGLEEIQQGDNSRRAGERMISECLAKYDG